GATAAASLARARSADEAKRAEAEPAFAPLRRTLAAEPARWGWQRDGDTPQAVNEALHHWLAQLDAAAGGRWQPMDTAPQRPGREIALLREGQLQHRFRFLDDGMAWQGPQGGWQRVTLPPASLRALASSAP
ncbi:MAG: hypothetical protein KF891_25565, partial [Rhizobacter sp.]|nr:hypothetical protein [Rhizobacter sp.]